MQVCLIFSSKKNRSPSTTTHIHKAMHVHATAIRSAHAAEHNCTIMAVDRTYSDMTSESALQVTPVKPHALEAGKVQSASTLLGSIIVFKVYRAAACCAARDPAAE